MSTTLSAMTAAELVAELKEASEILGRLSNEYSRTNWCFAPSDKRFHEENMSIWRKHEYQLTAELDARCEKAGICKNPNNTLSISEFTGTADELTEFLALVSYAKGTLK